MLVEFSPRKPARLRWSLIDAAQRAADEHKRRTGKRPAAAVIHVDARGRFVKLIAREESKT